MNVREIEKLGQRLVSLAKDYSGGPEREMRLDPALYAFLLCTGRKVDRQWHANLPGYDRSPRIDFRIGGSNPVLLEFAVRRPSGGSSLYGSQNQSELRKLARFGKSSAKLRALLLVDLSPWPIEKAKLRATYDKVHCGRGRFKRSPVKVIYTCSDSAYSFKWDPYKTA